MKKLLRKWVGFYLTKKQGGIEVTFYKVKGKVYCSDGVKPLSLFIISFLYMFYDKLYINFEKKPKVVLPSFFEKLFNRSIGSNVSFELSHIDGDIKKSMTEALYRIKVLSSIK